MNRLRGFGLHFIVLTAILLGACTLPTTHRYHILFVFEQPYGHPAYPVAPLDIVVAVIVPYPPGYRPGSVPGSLPILNAVDFFANGLEIGTATTISVDSYPTVSLGGITIGQLFHASRTWTPPAPGLYYLQAHATLMMGGPVSGDYSDAIQVCVVGDGFPVSACVPTATPFSRSPVPFSAPFSLTTPTPTPASAQDCPSGTFFAEATHKCIPIQIKTPKTGNQGGSCTDFTNPSACTTNGCSWDKITSTCN